ncbi:MAG: LysM domain-containing protein [Candidatus Gracilibacteria bacterium]|nr:LysM domain-containing protein [Candidatus Gracilibacteria bacterium]
MNTSPQFHTPAPKTQEPLRTSHSGVSKLSAVVSIATMLNVVVPAPISPSTRNLMDDTVGKAMTFVPPTQKTEVNAPKSHNILVKYTIQPGDTISTLACVFGVKKADLLKYNPQITDEDYIRAEDILIVPNPSRNIAKCTVQGDKAQEKTPQNIQTVTDTKEIQPLQMSREVRKAFLADDENILLLAKYVKNYYPKNFDSIKASSQSKKEKHEAYFALYEHDYNTFQKRVYVQEIKESHLDTKTAQNTEKLLEKAGYTATAKDYLRAKSHVESSGGLYTESIKEAQKLIKLGNEAKLKGTRGVYNKKITEAVDTALSQIVGDKNDIGPHGITPNWVRNEIEKGWNPGCELKLIDDFDGLKGKVRDILAGAVKNNLSQEQIAHQLTLIDSRFDSKIMGEAVLFSFNRICTRFMKKGISTKQAVKQAHITYNGRGPRAEKYAQKMHMTLSLMSALNKAQSGLVAKNTAPIKLENRDTTPVKHGIIHTYGIDPKKVKVGKVETNPITGNTLCAKTAYEGLIASGADPKKVERNDAIKLLRKWQKGSKGVTFTKKHDLKDYLVSQAKEHQKILGDMVMNTSDGHRAYSFFGTDEKLYISDGYRGDKKKPMLFDDYMKKNWGKSFTKVIVNARVGKIHNPDAQFVVKQKQPTPMPIIMASAPAGTVPVMIQSDGVYKLSQGVSTSVVKLTDTTTGDNHLHTDTDIGDDKMLFPAVTSTNIRKRIDLIRAQIDILTSNVTDPDVKARIEKKLGENPAWTMTQNIQLQKKRYMKGGNVQALKNAKGLYALLIMCEQELAKMPAFNKMAA